MLAREVQPEPLMPLSVSSTFYFPDILCSFNCSSVSWTWKSVLSNWPLLAKIARLFYDWFIIVNRGDWLKLAPWHCLPGRFGYWWLKSSWRCSAQVLRDAGAWGGHDFLEGTAPGLWNSSLPSSLGVSDSTSLYFGVYSSVFYWNVNEEFQKLAGSGSGGRGRWCSRWVQSAVWMVRGRVIQGLHQVEEGPAHSRAHPCRKHLSFQFPTP